MQTKKDVDMKVPPRRLTACRTLCRLLLRFKGVESRNIVDLFRHLVCEKDPLCRSFVVQLSHVVAHRLEKVVVAAFEDDTGTYAGVSCHEDDAWTRTRRSWTSICSGTTSHVYAPSQKEDPCCISCARTAAGSTGLASRLARSCCRTTLGSGPRRTSLGVGAQALHLNIS